MWRQFGDLFQANPFVGILLALSVLSTAAMLGAWAVETWQEVRRGEMSGWVFVLVPTVLGLGAGAVLWR